MIKVIATDLDGTLLKTEKSFSLIDKKSKKYIKSFYGDVVLVSGRNPVFCAKICNKLKIHHNFIALNGAVIVKNGNAIYRQSLKKTALSALLEFIESYYNNFELLIFDKYDKQFSYTPSNIFKLKFQKFIGRLKNSKLNQKVVINNRKVKKLLVNQTDIYKAIIYNKNCEDMYNLLKKEFNEHFEFFPTNHSIEISPKGVNKGAALQYLINTTKLTNDDILVVGDDTNDISMFDLFEHSFAMSSSTNFVKSKAKHVIDHFADLSKHTKINHNFIEEKNE